MESVPTDLWGKNVSKKIAVKGGLKRGRESKDRHVLSANEWMFDEGRNGLSGQYCRGFCNWGMKRPMWYLESCG